MYTTARYITFRWQLYDICSFDTQNKRYLAMVVITLALRCGNPIWGRYFSRSLGHGIHTFITSQVLSFVLLWAANSLHNLCTGPITSSCVHLLPSRDETCLTWLKKAGARQVIMIKPRMQAFFWPQLYSNLKYICYNWLWNLTATFWQIHSFRRW